MSDGEPPVPGCPDCGTALIPARLYSPFSSPAPHAEQLPVLVWRCESCGHAQPQARRLQVIHDMRPKGSAYMFH